MTPPDAPEPREPGWTVAEHGGEGEDTQAERDGEDRQSEEAQAK